MKNLIEIKHLTVKVQDKLILKDVSLNVAQGKITAIVGGSGSGKSTLASSILGLLPGELEITSGQIFFEGQQLVGLNDKHLRAIRGRDIAMVYQEPLWALNPLMNMKQQMEEVLVAHGYLNPQKRIERIKENLQRVELTNPEDMMKRYPHQLSGGQRQRVMIAQALMTNPKLIIADEPTSHLDVTVQAKIMDLLREFNKEGMSLLLISHDLGLVSHLADEVVVLHKGVVVEAGPVKSLMKKPQHAYTKALMEVFE